ncbi:MAG: radical SAM protein, partial [Candidatus Accumulibacter sp.]|nr:radical SAM protein [Accumulibacter sp.]
MKTEQSVMAVRYLILIVTTRCNLNCRYCYNGDDAGADMTPEILGRAFALASGGSEPLHVQITGGEPTLRPDILALAAEEARRLSRPVTLAMQTNGTLLTPELLVLCRTQSIEIGVSLDGPPAVNELTRGGSRELLEGLKLLEMYGMDFN